MKQAGSSDSTDAAAERGAAEADAGANLAALKARFRPFFARIAELSPEWERDRTSLAAEVSGLMRAGFGALRLPRSAGGSGASIGQLFHLLMELGEADSNVVQILRSHFGFVEVLLYHPDEVIRQRWFERIAAGDMVGAAMAERMDVGDLTTVVTRRKGHWTVSGEKFYCTGTLYADWIHLLAKDGEEFLSFLVSTKDKGVTRIDDWDGVGQRLTASGTTRFVDARFNDADIFNRFRPEEVLAEGYIHAFYQQIHLATIAGIGRAALRDCVDYVRSRTRLMGADPEVRPRDNPLVQRVVGRLSSMSFALDSIVDSVSAALERAEASHASASPSQQCYIDADLAAFRGQQMAIDLILQETSLLFEVGGATAVTAPRGLDRHWRNARTIASHNPAIIRERMIGDYCLNGTSPRPPSANQDQDVENNNRD